MITNVPTTQELTESSALVTGTIVLILFGLLIAFSFGLPYIAQQNSTDSNDGSISMNTPEENLK